MLCPAQRDSEFREIVYRAAAVFDLGTTTVVAVVQDEDVVVGVPRQLREGL